MGRIGEISSESFAGVDIGHASSQWRIGNAFHNGDGVPVDFAKAAEWYYMAADQGHVDAQFCVATMLKFGYGVTGVDKALSAQYFHMAAVQGHVDAQYWIGDMYSNGDGVSKNHELAVEWFRKAAEQGDGPAQFWLERDAF